MYTIVGDQRVAVIPSESKHKNRGCEIYSTSNAWNELNFNAENAIQIFCIASFACHWMFGVALHTAICGAGGQSGGSRGFRSRTVLRVEAKRTSPANKSAQTKRQVCDCTLQRQEQRWSIVRRRAHVAAGNSGGHAGGSTLAKATALHLLELLEQRKALWVKNWRICPIVALFSQQLSFPHLKYY